MRKGRYVILPKSTKNGAKLEIMNHKEEKIDLASDMIEAYKICFEDAKKQSIRDVNVHITYKWW